MLHSKIDGVEKKLERGSERDAFRRLKDEERSFAKDLEGKIRKNEGAKEKGDMFAQLRRQARRSFDKEKVSLSMPLWILPEKVFASGKGTFRWVEEIGRSPGRFQGWVLCTGSTAWILICVW